jgi:hypothetical protein
LIFSRGNFRDRPRLMQIWTTHRERLATIDMHRVRYIAWVRPGVIPIAFGEFSRLLSSTRCKERAFSADTSTPLDPQIASLWVSELSHSHVARGTNNQTSKNLIYIFLLDTVFVIFNNLPPRMVINELKMDLVCPESCFQASPYSRRVLCLHQELEIVQSPIEENVALFCDRNHPWRRHESVRAREFCWIWDPKHFRHRFR